MEDRRWAEAPDWELVESALRPSDLAQRRAALSEVYRRHGDAILAVCARYFSDDPDGARDAAQLSTRKGLRGKALAITLNVTEKKANDHTSENLQRAYRGFGAYVIARDGRRYCPGLARILDQAAWDGETFTRALRLRILRHLDDCKTCDNCVTCNRQRDRLVPRYAPALIPVLVAAAVGQHAQESIQRTSMDSDDEDSDGEERKKKKPSLIEKISTAVARVVMVAIAIWVINTPVGHQFLRQILGQGNQQNPLTGTHTLGVWTYPGYGIASDPPGLNCIQPGGNTTCHHEFTAGTRVTLTMIRDPSIDPYASAGWIGCANGTPAISQPCTVVMSTDVAVCQRDPDYTAIYTVADCRGLTGIR